MEERDICRTETIEAEVESLMGIIQLVRAGVLQEQRTGFLIPSAVETILIEAENRRERESKGFCMMKKRPFVRLREWKSRLNQVAECRGRRGPGRARASVK